MLTPKGYGVGRSGPQSRPSAEEDLRLGVLLGADELELARRLRQGHPHDRRATQRGHLAEVPVGDRLAHEIEQRVGCEARAVVLGHVQRGGTPTAFDRWLATRLGLHAVDAVAEGDFGVMTALRGASIVRVPLAEATGELKTVSPQEYAEAQVFFG